MHYQFPIYLVLLSVSLIYNATPAFSIPRFKLPKSGLCLEKTRDLGQFMDVSGHKSVYIGTEGGSGEVWIYPFKAVNNLEISYLDGKSSISTANALKKYQATPEASIYTCELGNGIARQILFTPVDHRGFVVLHDLPATGSTEIVTRFNSDLKPMWPAPGSKGSPVVSIDPDTKAILIASSDGKRFILVGGTNIVSTKIDTQPLEIRQIVQSEDAMHQYPALVISGDENLEGARHTFHELLNHTKALYAENCRYYKGLINENLRITTPDPALDEAFEWAKIGLDKCFVESGVGAGFVAGFNPSKGGNRPGYGWYFGRDSSWTGFSANFIGESDKAARNIDLLTKYQIPDGDNKGKIYHELSSAHESCLNKNYSYVAGDSTPLYVIDLYNYLCWTGDTEFVRKHWPNIKAAMNWCYRMDVDSDGLIDNPPAGHEWYDHGEKNMIDLVAIWQKALESAAAMGRIFNDPEADKWARDARKVDSILIHDFWNARINYFSDRKLPNGAYTDISTANPCVPLLWGQIDGSSEAKRRADVSIAKLSTSDFDTGWGIRTNSKADSIYNPSGYHEGTVWPLVTGWASLAAFRTHNAAQGLKWLDANASLYKECCLGYMTEILRGDERRAGGCPHQAWSEAMVIQPVAEGLMGIQVDAVAHRVIFAPHIPADWANVSVENLKVGKDKFNFKLTRLAGRLEIIVEHSGSGNYTVDLSPALAKNIQHFSASIDGMTASVEVQESLHDTHPVVHLKVNKVRHTVVYNF